MTTTAPPWDAGIDTRVDELFGDPPDALDVAWVIENHLKLPAESADALAVGRYVKAATRMAQRTTLKALVDQSYRLHLSQFPAAFIQLPWPPLLAIVSFKYYDQDGTQQTLTAGDAGYQLQRPVGARARNARLYPGRSLNAWPAVQSNRVDPVTIEYRAGYTEDLTDEDATIPADILEGCLLVIGEMHKQRSESIVGFGVSVNPALVRARGLWLPYGIGGYR